MCEVALPNHGLNTNCQLTRNRNFVANFSRFDAVVFEGHEVLIHGPFHWYAFDYAGLRESHQR